MHSDKVRRQRPAWDVPGSERGQEAVATLLRFRGMGWTLRQAAAAAGIHVSTVI